MILYSNYWGSTSVPRSKYWFAIARRARSRGTEGSDHGFVFVLSLRANSMEHHIRGPGAPLQLRVCVCLKQRLEPRLSMMWEYKLLLLSSFQSRLPRFDSRCSEPSFLSFWRLASNNVCAGGRACATTRHVASRHFNHRLKKHLPRLSPSQFSRNTRSHSPSTSTSVFCTIRHGRPISLGFRHSPPHRRLTIPPAPAARPQQQ